MSATLNRIYQQLQADPLADLTMVCRQREFVYRHTECIHRRAILLDSIAERFQSAKRNATLELSDIESALLNLDSWIT